MPVGEVCNREVIVVEPEADAFQASRLMREFHVGDLVVVERHGEGNFPLGIVTDRDLVMEVLSQGIDPASVVMKDLMGEPLETVNEDEALLDTLQRMREKGLRRMPVVNDSGTLQGILTMDDILELLAGELMDVVALSVRQRQKEKKQRP